MKYLVGYIEKEVVNINKEFLPPLISYTFEVIKIQGDHIEDRYMYGVSKNYNPASRILKIFAYLRVIKAFDNIKDAEEYKKQLNEQADQSHSSIEDFNNFKAKIKNIYINFKAQKYETDRRTN